MEDGQKCGAKFGTFMELWVACFHFSSFVLLTSSSRSTSWTSLRYQVRHSAVSKHWNITYYANRWDCIVSSVVRYRTSAVCWTVRCITHLLYIKAIWDDANIFLIDAISDVVQRTILIVYQKGSINMIRARIVRIMLWNAIFAVSYAWLIDDKRTIYSFIP